MTIKNVRETGQKQTEIARITLLKRDGSETVINISESIHFIFGFAKSDPKQPSPDNDMEIMVAGNEEICGEMYFQMGKAYPPLVDYCVRRAKEKIARAVIAEINRSGIDPIGEALKKMERGEKARWN